MKKINYRSLLFVFFNPNQPPNVQTLNFETNSVKFDSAFGTRSNFQLSSTMALAPNLMIYILLTGTFDIPGSSNGTFTLKLGSVLRFRI